MDNYNFKKLSSSSILVKNGNKTVVLSGRYTAEYRDKNNNDILVIKNKYDNEILESIDVSVDNISIDDVGKSYNEAEELYLELDSLGIFFLDSSNVSESALAEASSGIELTGAFAGKPLSNSYIWESGEGIFITQDDIDNDRYKTFSLDRDVHLVVDTPYWTSPTPADHTDKGVFGGSYLPSDVPTVFDYVTVDSDTYEDGSNIATTGGIDMSNFKVGDTIRVRFDFNCIPQIANTTIEPAIWYKNRDENDNVTFTFPLTATPIFYGTGTVGKSHLNRVEMSVYIASDEDINALAKFAIKSDNIVIIQPLSVLLTLVR
jgi:hypothetical protein